MTKKGSQELALHIGESGKDSVNVDSNGNGLRRLWQEQLTSFPLSRLETSEAIMDKYGTPAQLMAVNNMP